MTLNVLGISTSPRQRSNSDLLLREALRGAESAGAAAEYVALGGLDFGPCVACGACARTGRCRFDDPFQEVFEKMLAADRLVFATPVYFAAVCSQGKRLLDLCQCLWSRKYLMKEPLYPAGPRDRRALVIAVGGSRGKKVFDGIRLTTRYWFDSLEMTCFANLFVNQVDAAGDVLKHPRAMAEALRLGAALADADSPAPETPTDVELFEGLGDAARPVDSRDGS